MDDHSRHQLQRLSRLAQLQDYIAGTDRALAAIADAEVVAVPAFTGAPEQLWRIDQLTDGTYRIMPKAVPIPRNPWF